MASAPGVSGVELVIFREVGKHVLAGIGLDERMSKFVASQCKRTYKLHA